MVTQTKNVEVIDAAGVDFTSLNERIHTVIDAGCRRIVLNNICGQRYIGCGIGPDVHITINGVPGNDLAMFMGGAQIVVNGNVQDCVANTMDSGSLVIHGRSGDTLGHGMRGGEIYVKGDVGTRVGIHMKSYEEKKPVLVIGGSAGNFLGEYMAGGILIVLGLDHPGKDIVGRFVATGMHGGTIYLRGTLDEFQMGKEVKIFDLTDQDYLIVEKYVSKYCDNFNADKSLILKENFVKLEPYSHRPYGKLYAY